MGPFEASYLVVGAVLLLTLAALEQVGGGAASLGHLVLADGFLGHDVPQLLKLITSHLLRDANKCTSQQECRGGWK